MVDGLGFPEFCLLPGCDELLVEGDGVLVVLLFEVDGVLVELFPEFWLA
jgi:hypothetical protein